MKAGGFLVYCFLFLVEEKLKDKAKNTVTIVSINKKHLNKDNTPLAFI